MEIIALLDPPLFHDVPGHIFTLKAYRGQTVGNRLMGLQFSKSQLNSELETAYPRYTKPYRVTFCPVIVLFLRR